MFVDEVSLLSILGTAGHSVHDAACWSEASFDDNADDSGSFESATTSASDTVTTDYYIGEARSAVNVTNPDDVFEWVE